MFELARCIAALRSRDPLTYESAYLEILPWAKNFVPELVREMLAADDGYTRGKFIELLGHAADPTTVPIVAAELAHVDQNVRQWAVAALRRIGTPEAVVAASRYEAQHPEEFS